MIKIFIKKIFNNDKKLIALLRNEKALLKPAEYNAHRSSM